MNYLAAKAYIINRLDRELAPDLYYHGKHHTLDVLGITEKLCEIEGVNTKDRTLLKTAALYHDAGFVITNVEHEKIGCEIVKAHLPWFGYSKESIEAICGMIMATRIPQTPHTPLEEILCDADLDYLGRNDFYTIGRSLFEELKAYNVLQTEEAWNRLQVNFLKAHQFFTATNRKTREPRKQEYLAQLEKIVENYST